MRTRPSPHATCRVEGVWGMQLSTERDDMERVMGKQLVANKDSTELILTTCPAGSTLTRSTEQWPRSCSTCACSARCFQPRGAKVAWEPSAQARGGQGGGSRRAAGYLQHAHPTRHA